ncbi:unnamed protein product [Closterium sp. Naga37s-1]|nr:unnamed protein product [Closterium sp. Naga37s-1]
MAVAMAASARLLLFSPATSPSIAHLPPPVFHLSLPSFLPFHFTFPSLAPSPSLTPSLSSPHSLTSPYSPPASLSAHHFSFNRTPSSFHSLPFSPFIPPFPPCPIPFPRSITLLAQFPPLSTYSLPASLFPCHFFLNRVPSFFRPLPFSPFIPIIPLFLPFLCPIPFPRSIPFPRPISFPPHFLPSFSSPHTLPSSLSLPLLAPAAFSFPECTHLALTHAHTHILPFR